MDAGAGLQTRHRPQPVAVLPAINTDKFMFVQCGRTAAANFAGTVVANTGTNTLYVQIP
jgi:hypothetical protein